MHTLQTTELPILNSEFFVSQFYAKEAIVRIKKGYNILERGRSGTERGSSGKEKKRMRDLRASSEKEQIGLCN